jgi:hypothetical protein
MEEKNFTKCQPGPLTWLENPLQSSFCPIVRLDDDTEYIRIPAGDAISAIFPVDDEFDIAEY